MPTTPIPARSWLATLRGKARASPTQRSLDVWASGGHLQMVLRRTLVPCGKSALPPFRCYRRSEAPASPYGTSVTGPCALGELVPPAPTWDSVRHASSLGFRGSTFRTSWSRYGARAPLQSGPSHLSDCVLSEDTHLARCQSYALLPSSCARHGLAATARRQSLTEGTAARLLAPTTVTRDAISSDA